MRNRPTLDEQVVAMQAESRARHANAEAEAKPKKESIWKLLDEVKTERKKPGPKKKPKPKMPIEPPPEKICKQMGRPKGSKNKPKPKKNKVDFSKVASYAKRGRPREVDRIKPPLSFTRPPAVYSNTSPYGIAAELLLEQLKKVS